MALVQDLSAAPVPREEWMAKRESWAERMQQNLQEKVGAMEALRTVQVYTQTTELAQACLTPMCAFVATHGNM